jgi:hypothetical protein
VQGGNASTALGAAPAAGRPTLVKTGDYYYAGAALERDKIKIGTWNQCRYNIRLRENYAAMNRRRLRFGKGLPRDCGCDDWLIKNGYFSYRESTVINLSIVYFGLSILPRQIEPDVVC